jgi:hypothetical protein
MNFISTVTKKGLQNLLVVYHQVLVLQEVEQEMALYAVLELMEVVVRLPPVQDLAPDYLEPDLMNLANFLLQDRFRSDRQPYIS